MIPKWCLIQDIIIEGEIVAFTPGRDIYMLTLDEVEDGSYVHVCKPGRDKRSMGKVWFDLISAKLTEKTQIFSLNYLALWRTQQYT